MAYFENTDIFKLSIDFGKLFIGETLMTVRGLGQCTDLKLLESARIILLNDFADNKPKFRNHEPLKNQPSYESLNDPLKIVSYNHNQ